MKMAGKADRHKFTPSNFYGKVKEGSFILKKLLGKASFFVFFIVNFDVIFIKSEKLCPNSFNFSSLRLVRMR